MKPEKKEQLGIAIDADLALIQSEYYRTMYYKNQHKTHMQIPEVIASTFFEWHYKVKQGLSDDVFHQKGLL